jgi:hypothetical protein
MRPRERRETGEQDLFRSRLDQIIDINHPLVRLARTVDYQRIKSFLINCSAANWASASDAKSSGVTTLLRRPWEARTRTGGATARRGDYLPSQVSRGLRCSLVQFAS